MGGPVGVEADPALGDPISTFRFVEEDAATRLLDTIVIPAGANLTALSAAVQGVDARIPATPPSARTVYRATLKRRSESFTTRK